MEVADLTLLATSFTTLLRLRLVQTISACLRVLSTVRLSALKNWSRAENSSPGTPQGSKNKPKPDH